MRHVGADDLVARPAVHQHRDLIAHSARRQKHGRFLAQMRRDAVLQSIGGRILATLLVADLGFRHRLAHPGRRLGLGVAVEVDDRVAGQVGLLELVGAGAKPAYKRVGPVKTRDGAPLRRKQPPL